MSEYLPQEVVIQILTKLPPKTLIKFRCVSKTWNSLISSPYFISMHTQQTLLSDSGTNQIIVRRYSKDQNSEVYSVHLDKEDQFPDDKNIRIEYPFRDCIRFYYRIVGSCNGVFCLFDDLFGQADSILLWNPVIKRKVILPAPQASFENMEYYMFVLGFGFDVVNNDYKVVRMAYIQGDNGYIVPPEVEVYALSTKNWHKINGEVPNCVVEYFWSQVLINGNVNWVAYRNRGKEVKVENLIMLFDLTREVFDEMPLPDALENELPINLIGVNVKGSLGVVHYEDRIWSMSCCIWVMTKYGDVKSWSKLYYVDFEGGPGMILGFRTNGDVLLSADNLGLVSYDPVTGKSADLGVHGTKDSFYASNYMESLALLAEGKEARERLPSDSDGDSESESSMEVDIDPYGDVERSEFWMQCSMSQYLTALLKRSDS
ncbi:hypothetical protein DH2020_022653 [Rehmannia glutinosa]|uniref:F-box domain-containing protein n=1 Tax=Rehmannia glutinosa TaxID=99300 RepID=A0ABR0W851_REHGL